ncbi:MAG: hypothetical protein ACYSYM_16660, partial [Planctomycetota bacterium]
HPAAWGVFEKLFRQDLRDFRRFCRGDPTWSPFRQALGRHTGLPLRFGGWQLADCSFAGVKKLLTPRAS